MRLCAGLIKGALIRAFDGAIEKAPSLVGNRLRHQNGLAKRHQATNRDLETKTPPLLNGRRCYFKV